MLAETKLRPRKRRTMVGYRCMRGDTNWPTITFAGWVWWSEKGDTAVSVHQPSTYIEETYWNVYNGQVEIYNAE